MIVRRLLSHRSLRAITAADRKAFAALMRKNTEPATEFGVDCLDFTLRIADIVHEIGMERSSIVLALVDPYVRYGAVSIAEVRETFGEDIAHLVELLRKSESKTITLENISDKQFSDFVLSFVEDIRVVIHLIAFHYEAMKAMMPTLNPLPGETPSADNKLPLREDADYEDLMVRLATSSRMFFAPIAHRLGLYNIKRELEDMTIRIEHPKEYDDIMRGLRQTRQER